jgi:hypothetical protein
MFEHIMVQRLLKFRGWVAFDVKMKIVAHIGHWNSRVGLHEFDVKMKIIALVWTHLLRFSTFKILKYEWEMPTQSKVGSRVEKEEVLGHMASYGWCIWHL